MGSKDHMDSSVTPTQKKSVHNASVVFTTGSQTPDLGVCILEPGNVLGFDSAAHLCPYARKRAFGAMARGIVRVNADCRTCG